MNLLADYSDDNSGDEEKSRSSRSRSPTPHEREKVKLPNPEELFNLKTVDNKISINKPTESDIKYFKIEVEPPRIEKAIPVTPDSESVRPEDHPFPESSGCIVTINMIEEDRANMKKSRAPEAYAKKLKNDKRRGINQNVLGTDFMMTRFDEMRAWRSHLYNDD